MVGMKVLFRLFFLLCTLSGFAQEQYYIYIDSEQKAGFYLHHRDTIISSKGGYLILPSLQKGNYEFRIGLQRDKKQYVFSIDIQHKDRAFTIKESENGLSLHDLTAGVTILPSRVIGGNLQDISTSMRTDPYAVLLANVVNDSAVLYNIVRVDEGKKQEEVLVNTVSEPVSIDSMLVAANAAEQTERQDTLTLAENKMEIPEPDFPVDSLTQISKDSLAVAEEHPADLKESVGVTDSIGIYRPDSALVITARPSEISLSDSLMADSLHATAVIKDSSDDAESVMSELTEEDGERLLEEGEKLAEQADSLRLMATKSITLVSDNVKDGLREIWYKVEGDTVNVLIALDPVIVEQDPEWVQKTEPEPVKAEEKKPDPEQKVTVEEKKEPGKEETVKTEIPQEPVRKGGLMINSNCVRFATDAEIDKLRVKMMKEASDYAKLKVAEKLFKQKCFTVRQTIALSELFSDDDGKYNFFEAVYPFLSDSGNFILLSQYLQSEFYKKRLKALIPSTP